jgi:hypothetical protein
MSIQQFKWTRERTGYEAEMAGRISIEHASLEITDEVQVSVFYNTKTTNRPCES